PTGYRETFRRSQGAEGKLSVAVTTQEGREAVYSLQSPSEAQLLRSIKAPSQAELRWDELVQSQTTTEPNGTVTSVIFTADPRFGTHTLLPSSVTATTPGGRELSLEQLRTVDADDDSLLVKLWIEDTEINGRLWTSHYAQDARTLSTTTPEGRTGTVT